MPGGREISRRTLIQALLAGLPGRRLAAESQTESADLIRPLLRTFVPGAIFQRRYRVDATVLLCGIPVISRRGVGSGYACVESSRSGESNATGLQFAAGSCPERAHGLNRFGILQEALVRRSGGTTQLAFAGLLTSSKEENIDQARQAFTESARGIEATVIRGATYGDRVRTWLDTMPMPADNPPDSLGLSLSRAISKPPQFPPREVAAAEHVTFLCAMQRAGLDRAILQRRPFLHSGKVYTLETRRPAKNPDEIKGAIFDASGVKRSEFHAAYEPDSPSGIPVRIECRVRSFLRLAFIAEPEAEPQSVPSLFSKETI